MAGLLAPGPTLAAAEELRAKRGSRGLLESVGTPLSYAPLPPVAAIGQGLLGARYLTGEAEPMQGLAGLSDMTAMMVWSKLPTALRALPTWAKKQLDKYDDMISFHRARVDAGIDSSVPVRFRASEELAIQESKRQLEVAAQSRDALLKTVAEMAKK